jgi:hypothetical protein
MENPARDEHPNIPKNGFREGCQASFHKAQAPSPWFASFLQGDYNGPRRREWGEQTQRPFGLCVRSVW